MVRSWRPWRSGFPCQDSTVCLLVWQARRAGPARWTLAGLFLALLLAGTLFAVQPVADADVLTLPTAPLAVAADGHTHRLYIATADNRVWVLDSGDLHVVGAVAVDSRPLVLAADSDNERAYVATLDGLTVLTANASTVGSPVDLGQPATAIALDPALHRMYVTTAALDHDTSGGSLDDGSVVVLDTTSDAVVARVIVGVDPLGLAVDPRSHRLYVAVAGAGDVDVLGGEPLAVDATIAVGGTPYRLSIDAEAGRVYVTDCNAPRLSVVDEASNTVQSVVAVGQLPDGVAVDPATRRVFVANRGDGTITVLHSPDATPLATLRVGDQPADLAVRTNDGQLFITDAMGRSLWLVDDHRFQPPTARLFARVEAPDDEPVPSQ